MKSDPFIKSRLINLPSMEKDIWKEWLLSALERLILLPTEVIYSELNKEVIDYLDNSDLLSYTKSLLSEISDIIDLLDYSKKETNIIIPLLVTLLLYKQTNKSNSIIDLITKTSFYSKLETELIKDKEFKFYCNSSKKTEIQDKNIQTVKISKGRS